MLRIRPLCMDPWDNRALFSVLCLQFDLRVIHFGEAHKPTLAERGCMGALATDSALSLRPGWRARLPTARRCVCRVVDGRGRASGALSVILLTLIAT